MTDVTTIKVPETLRDRLSERARRDHVALAVVISRALDESDERAFWSSVQAEHARLTPSERAAYVADATLADSLDDADDDVSARNGW